MASVGCDGSHLGWWTGSSSPGTMVASLSAGWFVVLFIYFVIFLKKQGESNWEMGSFCAGWCACPGNHRDRGAHGWLWEEAGWLLLRPSQLQCRGDFQVPLDVLCISWHKEKGMIAVGTP